MITTLEDAKKRAKEYGREFQGSVPVNLVEVLIEIAHTAGVTEGLKQAVEIQSEMETENNPGIDAAQDLIKKTGELL